MTGDPFITAKLCNTDGTSAPKNLGSGVTAGRADHSRRISTQKAEQSHQSELKMLQRDDLATTFSGRADKWEISIYSIICIDSRNLEVIESQIAGGEPDVL